MSSIRSVPKGTPLWNWTLLIPSFGLVAQVLAHLRVHHPFDHGLLERQKQVLHLGCGHRSLHQLLDQLRRHLRQRASGCRLGGCGSLLGRHIHDLPSCYASPTKSRIGSFNQKCVTSSKEVKEK